MLLIDHPQDEMKLRKNNPSLKIAWHEVLSSTKDFANYRIGLKKGDAFLTDDDRKHLIEFGDIVDEKYRNYYLVLKLITDY